MMVRTDSKAGDQSGAALILAVFMIVALTVVVYDIVDMVREDVNSVIQYKDRIQARQNALLGIDAARFLLMYDLEEDQRKNRKADFIVDATGLDDLVGMPEIWSLFASNNETARSMLGLDGAVFSIENGGAFMFQIEDLSASYPLNRVYRKKGLPEKSADYKNALHFLDIVGLEELQAKTFLDSLLDWLDNDDEIRPYGAEAEQYDGLEKPYLPRNMLLISPDEFRAINGVDDAVFAELVPYVTAYPNHLKSWADYKINVNTAPAEVLTALDEDMTLDDAEQIVNERETSGPFVNNSYFNNFIIQTLGKKDMLNRIVKAQNYSRQSNTFRITGFGYAGRTEVIVETVVHRQRKGNDVWTETLLLRTF